MTKKLVKHGNSYALVFDQTMMGILGITAESELEIVTDGRSYLITPKDGATAGAREIVAEARRKARG